MAWLNLPIYLSQSSFCRLALPPRSQSLSFFEKFIKTAHIHKHIAALNNAIHHVEQHMHCSFPNMTIMQLIIVFNEDYNHFFHYCTLLLLLAVKGQNLT